VLPYWREQPRFERVAGFPDFQSACHAPPFNASAGPSPNATRGTHAGVLVSQDRGVTWEVHGNLTDPRTDLIEGSLALVNGSKLKMLLRTNTGCAFQATSLDAGRSWGSAEPVSMPNPNSKSHMVRLQPSGYLAVAFNNHHRSSACKNCRTHLHVVVSRDGGTTWRNVATLEDSMEANVRVHYPTLLQVGNMLHVVYSRFYLGRCKANKDQMTMVERAEMCAGLSSMDQGIKMAEVDLTHLETLPQMRLPPDSDRVAPSKRALYGMLHHFVETEVPRNMEAMFNREAALGIIIKLRQMKWKDVASILALIYDLDYTGGARFLRSHKGLGEMFKQVLQAHTSSLREHYSATHAVSVVKDTIQAQLPSSTDNPPELLADSDTVAASDAKPQLFQGSSDLLTQITRNSSSQVQPFISVRPLGYGTRRRIMMALLSGESKVFRNLQAREGVTDQDSRLTVST